jgi:hypothetical protein
MRRLLETPSQKNLWLGTLLAFIGLAAIFLYLRSLDAQLAPYGIVLFEFAFTPARASEMITAWGVVGAHAARQSLLVDFGFMPAYALAFAGFTLLAARAARGRWQTLGLWLTLAPFVSWFFDATENFVLLATLSNPASSLIILAGISATIKFALLVACLPYMLGGLVATVWRKAR